MNPALIYIKKHYILCTLTSLFFIVILVRFITRPGDFNVFYASAVRFMEGAKIHLTEIDHFSYPTIASLFFVQISIFGHTAAKIIFLVISFFLMLLGIKLVNNNVIDQSPKKNLIFVISIFFSLRFILAGFENEQTDLLVFGLVIVGAYYYQRKSILSAVCWAGAAAIKANPLFLILLPLFHKEWKLGSYFLVLSIFLFLAPDLLKYTITPISEPYTLQIPKRIIPLKEEYIGQTRDFKVTPGERSAFAYVQEFTRMTFAKPDRSWWANKTGPLNQSLTKIINQYLGADISINVILLSLCGFFGLALLYLSQKNVSVFMQVMLFYSGFVLIGPMSSKAHFIAVYPLLLYCWHDTLETVTVSKLVFMLIVSASLGLTTAGIISDKAYVLAQFGHIGMLTLVLWIYTYYLLSKNERPVM